jgi:hypothetical protein
MNSFVFFGCTKLESTHKNVSYYADLYSYVMYLRVFKVNFEIGWLWTLQIQLNFPNLTIAFSIFYHFKCTVP